MNSQFFELQIRLLGDNGSSNIIHVSGYGNNLGLTLFMYLEGLKGDIKKFIHQSKINIEKMVLMYFGVT